MWTLFKLNAVKNGTADITLQYQPGGLYDFPSIYNQINSSAEPMIEKGNSPQIILYNFKSPIWGMNPIEPCTVHKDISCILTTTTIIDSTTPTTTLTTSNPSTPYSSIEIILSSMMVISILVQRRRKNK